MKDLCAKPGKGTLLLVNVKETLCRLDKDAAAYSALFTEVLGDTLAAVERHRGMVDVFIADKVHCSFNTSKPCSLHSSAAVRAAKLLTHLPVNIGIATGSVFRGDMGCSVMRRFSLLGGLLTEVVAMQRNGRVLDVTVLTTTATFADAQYEHEMRLVPQHVVVCEGQDPVCTVEVLLSQQQAQEEEWLYTVGATVEMWADYNKGVRMFLEGADVEDAVRAAGSKGAELRGSITACRAVRCGGDVVRVCGHTAQCSDLVEKSTA